MSEAVVISMTIVALALIIGMSLNGIVEKVMLTRRLRHDTEKNSGSIELKAIAERQQMIEDRLRVLERIATDRGTLLAEEIDALRRDSIPVAPVGHHMEVTSQ